MIPWPRLLLILTCLLLPLNAAATERENAVNAQIREILNDKTGPALGGETLMAPAAVRAFYQRRNHENAWLSGDLADQMLRAVQVSAAHGLAPEAYHGQSLELLQRLSSSAEAASGTWAAYDILLSDAFLALASHLAEGRVAPAHLHPEWPPVQPETDPLAALEQAVAQANVDPALHGLLPASPAYGKLKKSLAHLRLISAMGGWPTVPEGAILQAGTKGQAVLALRRRLLLSGDLSQHAPATPDFDETLTAALKKFQARHGRKEDGIVGPATLELLNRPIEKQIRRIIINMERWRWLPRDLDSPAILVNIADFSLSVTDGPQKPHTMRVIVGKPYRQTPPLASRIYYLVINPTWDVPGSIAALDILPQVRRDATYLQRLGFRILRGWETPPVEVDPAAVDWQNVDLDREGLRFRQEPGPANALGRIKFMFPNDYDVYMHDTPAQELFDAESRTFSSGCIRIDRPLELAAYLLQENGNWPQSAIEVAIAAGKTMKIRLPTPMPIRLLYMTAWVDEQGVLQLRPDVYGRDRALEEAFFQERGITPF